MSTKDRGPRLGRGLAALLGDTAPTDTGDNAVRLLAIGSLRPSPFQARRTMAQEQLDSLADSIRSSGILQPILVRPEPDENDAWQIVAGERRWRAAQLAGLHEVPCLIRRLTDTEAMTAGLIENLQRQDLNAIEEAEGYQRLSREFGMRQEDVAQIVGRSRSHVANTLRLLGLPPSVQGEVRNGSLSAGHARALLAHNDPQHAALTVISRGLNVRQTEALSHHRPARSLPKDAETIAVERQLAAHLGLRVSILHDGQGGSLRIGYSDLDQLDGLIRVLLQR
jgi:ParB family chromosome partitioning protein